MGHDCHGLSIELCRATAQIREDVEREKPREKHVGKKRKCHGEHQSEEPQQCVTGRGASPCCPEPHRSIRAMLYQRLPPQRCLAYLASAGDKGDKAEVTEAYLLTSLFLSPFRFHSGFLPLSPSCHPSLKTTCVSDDRLTPHSTLYREQAGCTTASDASEPCVSLAVGAVVNVDLESWQL